MCIRDSRQRRFYVALDLIELDGIDQRADDRVWLLRVADLCLLYTSDAADERSSVDLGGRRIIKKKKNI